MSPVQSIGPLYYVDGPPPRAPRYTLVGGADINPLTDEHWANGIQVHGYIPDNGSGFSVCDTGGSPGPQAKLDQQEPNPLPEFGPLTVYLAETCSTKSIMGGSWTQESANDQFKQRARDTFAAVESAALEREFWTGEFLPDNPHLASAAVDEVTSGATGLREGLALLEAAIAATGRAGVIHMSARLAAAYSTLGGGAGAIMPERGKLYTMLGTLIIPGAGYPGTGPDSDPISGTVEWAYATGPVEILRSGDFVMPPNLVEAIDREQNEITYRAERYYIAYWDTALLAGAEIDRCLDNCES